LAAIVFFGKEVLVGVFLHGPAPFDRIGYKGHFLKGQVVEAFCRTTRQERRQRSRLGPIQIHRSAVVGKMYDNRRKQSGLIKPVGSKKKVVVVVHGLKTGGVYNIYFLLPPHLVFCVIDMPNFRPKNPKKIIAVNKNAVTLDSKHREHVAAFQVDFKERLPLLEAKKAELQLLLKKQDRPPNASAASASAMASNSAMAGPGPVVMSVDKRLEVQDALRAVKKEIKEIHTKEQDYFLNNATHIFDYFENKKKIADGPATAAATASLTSSTTAVTANVLDSFFKIQEAEPLNDTAAGSPQASSHNSGGGGGPSNSVVQQYLCNVDDRFLDINHFLLLTNQCAVCQQGEMIPVEQEGVLVCNNCSKCCSYLEENEKPSYKEPPKEVCFYAYKRINHFREILAQFQAKESTQIPDEVIENINQQMKKERIKLSQVSNKRAKDILKKLGYNKYYEHIPFIKDKLGIKPPIMSAELENTLCNLFMDIQAPYAKFCPDDRVNFLNYYYTVYKLCELLDQQQFLPFFPMLKDREKRIEQDEIWRNICGELDWEYIPTV
jgi:hypothetical protein